MRRTFNVVAFAVLLAAPAAAWAHGGDEELGHHWESPAYIAEMRLQIVLMIAFACAVMLLPTAVRLWRKRSISR